MNRRSTIREKFLDCSINEHKEAAECDIVNRPLYLFRKGKLIPEVVSKKNLAKVAWDRMRGSHQKS